MMDRKGRKVTKTLAQRLSDFLKVVRAILPMKKIVIEAAFLETQFRNLTAKLFFPLKTVINYLRYNDSISHMNCEQEWHQNTCKHHSEPEENKLDCS